MDYFMSMDVLHSFHKLVDIIASFYFVKPLSSLYKVWKRLILADIQHDIHILLVFEVAIESNNILIV